MKKLKYILFLLLFTNSAFSNEAVVIVLQAPLLKEPSMESKVLQYIRQSGHVYVPSNVARQYPLPEFIETFDKTGNIAYIPSKYIKLITHDESEKLTPIAFQGLDPTDYRLAEPIPKTYPFSEYSFLKTSFSFTLGNNLKDPYSFNRTITNQNYSAETGGRFLIAKRMNFDKYDRLYYGAIINISSVTNSIEFNNGQILEAESRSVLKLGPILIYDAYKSENYRISFGSGFTYNYYRTLIKIASQPDPTVNGTESETRFFNGYSISPFFTAYVQSEDVVPNIDLILGTDISLNLHRTLNASGTPVFPSYWGTDKIVESTKPQATLFVGVQAKY